MKKITILLLVLLSVMFLTACGAAEEVVPEEVEEAIPEEELDVDVPAVEDEETTISTIVKLTGVSWFERMEEGVEEWDGEHPNVQAFQTGPAVADAAQQVQVIEDVIAQGVDAVTVVPFQPDTVEPVLARAREQGIVVVTHEAATAENIDAGVEAFDNEAYGEQIMMRLAECMGEDGQYVVFVGSLTSESHNQWVDAAIAYQQENYPDMEWVGDKNESFDDQQNAYETMQELLVTFPDLEGVQGSAATDVVGAGQAIEEAGLADETCVMGTSLASIAGDLIETGAVDAVALWDPALAGKAMNEIALRILQGEEIPDGADLGIPGYENVEKRDKVYYGEAWIFITEENLDEYDF